MRLTLYAFLWLIGLIPAILDPTAPPPRSKADVNPVSPIHFPDVPVPTPAPQPVPTPGPTSVDHLGPHQTYVLRTDVDSIVTASPASGVTIEKSAGPLKVHSIFTDGTGKYETRTYTEKFVWTVHAAKSGTVELLVIPSGAATDADVGRRTIQVDDGTAPIPPPGPVPPAPKPTPVAVTGEWLTIIVTGLTPDVATAKVVNGPTVVALKAANKCRIYSIPEDNDQMAAKGYDKVMKAANLSTPAFICLDKAGNVVASGKLPQDEASMAAKIKEVMMP